MEFTCLGTSSIGNCYLVKSGSSNILLDAGVPLNSVIKIWKKGVFKLCMGELTKVGVNIQ